MKVAESRRIMRREGEAVLARETLPDVGVLAADFRVLAVLSIIFILA